MKTLSQLIEEKIHNQKMKEVFIEKSVEEDLSDIMRTCPSKNDGIMRGTISDKEE